MAGVGRPVEVARVEDDEAAGGVEDVDGPGVGGVDVPDDRGEDGRGAGLVGEREHVPGMAAAARRAVGAAVADDLDDEGAGRQEPPPGEQEAGPGRLPGEQRAADVGVGPEERGGGRRPP